MRMRFPTTRMRLNCMNQRRFFVSLSDRQGMAYPVVTGYSKIEVNDDTEFWERPNDYDLVYDLVYVPRNVKTESSLCNLQSTQKIFRIWVPALNTQSPLRASLTIRRSSRRLWSPTPRTRISHMERLKKRLEAADSFRILHLYHRHL